ncbi:glycosyltransferase family 4 protein [Oxalobacter aliiformigenes]|uniref:Glycosyltransferase family 4 protein n=1 Tax=Oxalobacter aliiformigenes TaxID=2946593 RepID=A0A9E9LMF1_9BURK|nr:glycosyltransferase family 1 protein [Oxalobacter aliiformigenes]WAV90764.1 glycosyltransferase family 4 protein [Oxalobacter aliiformigenes]WAV92802.1 glycosyltransferase family 4 protein [Oxalobacter aliiformigenes]WAV95693.1 glycosyltransferase family 4 protein [Oxalobacter aliiformigenes]WAV96512.1 glycosyltransferase family 4 protein [Oxalobacter aliiformigenes]
MRILIDMQAAQNISSHRGIGRYIVGFAKGLIASCNHHEIFLLFNAAYPQEISRLESIFRPILPKEHLLFWHSPVCCFPDVNDDEIEWHEKCCGKIYAFTVMKYHIDLLINGGIFHDILEMDGAHGLPFLAGKVKLAVVVYDFLPFQDSKCMPNDLSLQKMFHRRYEYYQFMDVFLCISDFTASECRRYFPNRNIVSISSAADAVAENIRNIDLTPFILDKPFILYAGGMDERKNVGLLIEAFGKMTLAVRQKHQLVIVCGRNPHGKMQILGKLAEMGIKDDDVKLLNYVTDNELAWLYSNCKLFVFPSLAEGFGLPPLEAMMNGAPVIASNATSLPEIIGMNEALFDPTDVESLRGKMERALTDECFLEILRQNSNIQTQKFSWKLTGKRAIDAFENAEFTSRKTDRTSIKKEDLLQLLRELSLPGLSVVLMQDLARSVVRSLQYTGEESVLDVIN